MNKFEQIFHNKKAFIPFITAGDSDLSVTEQLIYAMETAGADLIELGLPFSDPMAEGPVIQAADVRALKSGTTTDKIFTMVKKVRVKSQIPLAIMTYVNPIFSYGTDRFMKAAKECGICCVIVPDLPFEEKAELEPFCRRYDISLISMIAPTSKERTAMIAKEAEGFIYCVSSMGVTGVRNEITTDVDAMVRRIKDTKEIPCAIGFGIQTPEQARKMAMSADGVIVGSAIVKIIAEYGENCVKYVADYVREIKNAIN